MSGPVRTVFNPQAVVSDISNLQQFVGLTGDSGLQLAIHDVSGRVQHNEAAIDVIDMSLGVHYDLVTGLSGEINNTNLAVNKLQNNLQHTQLSAKAQAALKNIVPLILDKEIKEPLDLILLGYKIQFFNNGNGIIIGAPNITNPSDNPTPLYGRIYVYEFLNSNWYLTNTITEDDLELYGYGRYVSCSDDGKLISQCNWAAETEYKGTLLKAYANPDGITAKFPLSYYQGYTVTPDPESNPGEYYTVKGIDGTYAIDPEDGGSGYGDTVIVNFSPVFLWLQQYFRAAVSATTENGKVVSVTISGVDGIDYFENTTKAPDIPNLANGNLLVFQEPPPVYQNINTFTGAYEAKLSGDGSTIAVVRYPTPDSTFNFYIYDISGETVTEKLMEPGLLRAGNEGIWFAIDMTHDGSRIIVNSNGSKSSPYVFIKQLDGTFTKSTLATPTNHVKYNSLVNIELTPDGNHLIIGDRQSFKVDYYIYNNTNTSYEYVNSITSSHGNFGGGHSGIAISPNAKYIAISARGTALVGQSFWGAAYLYRKNVNGEWNKVATIPRNYESSSMFGNSIDITNDKIAVSTLNLDTSNPSHVDIYTITEDLDEYGLTAIRESINENIANIASLEFMNNSKFTYANYNINHMAKNPTNGIISVGKPQGTRKMFEMFRDLIVEKGYDVSRVRYGFGALRPFLQYGIWTQPVSATYLPRIQDLDNMSMPLYLFYYPTVATGVGNNAAFYSHYTSTKDDRTTQVSRILYEPSLIPSKIKNAIKSMKGVDLDEVLNYSDDHFIIQWFDWNTGVPYVILSYIDVNGNNSFIITVYLAKIRSDPSAPLTDDDIGFLPYFDSNIGSTHNGAANPSLNEDGTIQYVTDENGDLLVGISTNDPIQGYVNGVAVTQLNSIGDIFQPYFNVTIPEEGGKYKTLDDFFDAANSFFPNGLQ